MTTANQEIKALKSEMKELAAMVKDSASHAANSNGHASIAGFTATDLRRAARKAGRNVRQYVSEKQAQAEDLRDAAEDTITSNPFKAVAAAAASGLVVGLLMRGK